MNPEPWIHFAHVAGASVWVGGGVMLSLVGLRARRSAIGEVVGEFARLLSYAGLRVFTPAVIVVLVSGVWLVLSSSEWNLGQAWVLLALGGFGVAFLIGAVFLSRSAIQLDRIMTGTGDLSAARAAIGRWLLGYGVVLVVLVLVVWDMIFKPGADPQGLLALSRARERQAGRQPAGYDPAEAGRHSAWEERGHVLG
jgi:uncharacterized membrane protein